MKKKFGFTLAEVLITLAIIGVVAALTTPALVKNSGQAKIGPALAKFTNTFEVGMEQMLTEESISTLQDKVGSSMVNLSRYVTMTPFDGDFKFTSGDGTHEVSTITMAKDVLNAMAAGGAPSVDYNGDGNIDIADYVSMLNMAHTVTVWRLKDGTTMAVVPKSNFEAFEGAGSYKGVVAEVLLDFGGGKGTSRAGRTVFAFLLDGSGVLIPVGSNAHKFIGQNGSMYTLGFNFDKNECKTDGNYLNNFACTGDVADHGWKADY